MRAVGLVLWRAGHLVWIALRFGLLPYLAERWPMSRKRLPAGVRLRLALERLGLTYIKLGQFLAMRFDILPIEICRELDRLFENVPPAAFSEVRAVVEHELGAPLERHFRAFEQNPIASASVAQVHRATLQSGERVAIKIQRVGLLPIFQADMRILRSLAWPADTLGLTGTNKLAGVLAELEGWTSRELDFRLEAETAEQVGRGALPFEVEPRIYWDLTTAHVLTMEFLEGMSLAEVASLREAGGEAALRARLPNLDPDLVIRRFGFAALNQMFVTRVFHGDPHPGNILVLDDNTVAFVDFGIFGQLAEFERDLLANYLRHYHIGNIGEALTYHARLLQPTSGTDLRAYRRDLHTVMRQNHQVTNNLDAPVEDRHIGKGVNLTFEVIRRHHLRVSPSLLMFWRAIFAINTTALRLSPNVDLNGIVNDYFEQHSRSVVDQVLANTDGARLIQIADLVRDGADGVGQVLTALGSDQRQWRGMIWESAESEAGGNREALALSAGLMAVSLVLVSGAISQEVPAVVRLLPAAVAVPLLAWTAFSVGRR